MSIDGNKKRGFEGEEFPEAKYRKYEEESAYQNILPSFASNNVFGATNNIIQKTIIRKKQTKSVLKSEGGAPKVISPIIVKGDTKIPRKRIKWSENLVAIKKIPRVKNNHSELEERENEIVIDEIYEEEKTKKSLEDQYIRRLIEYGIGQHNEWKEKLRDMTADPSFTPDVYHRCLKLNGEMAFKIARGEESKILQNKSSIITTPFRINHRGVSSPSEPSTPFIHSFDSQIPIIPLNDISSLPNNNYNNNYIDNNNNNNNVNLIVNNPNTAGQVINNLDDDQLYNLLNAPNDNNRRSNNFNINQKNNYSNYNNNMNNMNNNNNNNDKCWYFASPAGCRKGHHCSFKHIL